METRNRWCAKGAKAVAREVFWRGERALVSRHVVAVCSWNLRDVVGVSEGIVAQRARASAQRHADARASHEEPAGVPIPKS